MHCKIGEDRQRGKVDEMEGDRVCDNIRDAGVGRTGRSPEKASARFSSTIKNDLMATQMQLKRQRQTLGR